MNRNGRKTYFFLKTKVFINFNLTKLFPRKWSLLKNTFKIIISWLIWVSNQFKVILTWNLFYNIINLNNVLKSIFMLSKYWRDNSLTWNKHYGSFFTKFPVWSHCGGGEDSRLLINNCRSSAIPYNYISNTIRITNNGLRSVSVTGLLQKSVFKSTEKRIFMPFRIYAIVK